MAKTISAKAYRKKNNTELLADLKKLREDLQQIRFTRVSGTAVSKLSKIKTLRKEIARVLTILRENKKNEVIANLKNRIKKEKKDDKEEEIKETIKNLKVKHIPIDLRAKKTRAQRKALTKFENNLLTLKQLKRKLNFPKRKFAVPFSKEG